MYNCFKCGHELIWQSDENRNDIDDMVNDDDTSIVSNYFCPYCGTSYEVYEAIDEEKNEYPYYSSK